MSLPSERPSEHKREYGRLKVAVDGQYRFEGTEDWLACSLIDISTKGMALSGKQSFYAGDKIEVHFALEKRVIFAKLEITNLIGRKAGGKITEIADDDLAAIQEVLNRELLSGKTPLT